MNYATQTKWKKKNTTLITVRLNKYTDADILKFLNSLDNKQGLIKSLLRTEMDNRGFVCPHPSKKEMEAYEEYLDELERKGEVGDYEKAK